MSEKLVQAIIVEESNSWSSSLSSAAIASLKAFKEWDSNWSTWLNSSFTKTVRRAKTSLFDKVLAFAESDTCSLQWHLEKTDRGRVIAFSPIAYDDFPKILKKCQVSGFTLSDAPTPTTIEAVENFELTYYDFIIVNSSLHMSVGKECAQVAHALWMLYKDMIVEEQQPLKKLQPFNIFHCEKDVFEALTPQSLHQVKDNGLTEVEPGSITVIVL